MLFKEHMMCSDEHTNIESLFASYFHWKALRFKNHPQMPNVTPVRSEKPVQVRAWGDQHRSTCDLDAAFLTCCFVVLFYPEGLSVNRHSPVIVWGFMEAVQRSVTKPQLGFTLVTVMGTGVWVLFRCSGIFKGFRFRGEWIYNEASYSL